MPTVYPRPLSIVRSFHRSNMSNHGVTSCRVHSPLLRGTIVLRAHTALTMIRSRHAVGRGFVALSPARSAGCPSTAAARAVSSQRDLSCPHSARPASKDAASASCSTFDHYRQYNSSSVRYYSASDSVLSSPFSGGIRIGNDSSTSEARKSNRKRKFIPRKAAVALTPKARTFFKSLLENVTSNQNDTDGKQSEDAIIGIQLTYSQSTTGEPRMVFGFSFLRASALHPNDEAVSLEVLEDGETPKPPADALEDGLPKLYVHHDAVLKVLGATLDVDQERLLPILHDKEGNVMDPNA